MSLQIRRVADVNPPTPELRLLNPTDEVTFMPLDAVWPADRRKYEHTKSAGTAGYTAFRRGDVLMPKITPTFEAGRVFVADDLPTETGLATTEVHVLRPTSVDARYLAYFLQSYPVLAEGAESLQGVGNLRRVTTEWVESLRLPVSGAADQRRIADYLDNETTTIDTLIEKQEALVTGLHERREAVATATLDAHVGVGERLKWVFRERDERAGVDWEAMDVLSVSIAWGVRRRNAQQVNQATSEELNHYKVVRPGDIVVNRMRAFQGALGVSSHSGVTSPDYGVMTVDTAHVLPEWLSAMMRTKKFVSEMIARLRGIGTSSGSAVRTPRVSLSDIGDIRLVVPPLDEQRRIADHLDQETAKIDALIAKAERFIELAQERRAALITAAVTGQISVD